MRQLPARSPTRRLMYQLPGASTPVVQDGTSPSSATLSGSCGAAATVHRILLRREAVVGRLGPVERDPRVGGPHARGVGRRPQAGDGVGRQAVQVVADVCRGQPHLFAGFGVAGAEVGEEFAGSIGLVLDDDLQDEVRTPAHGVTAGGEGRIVLVDAVAHVVQAGGDDARGLPRRHRHQAAVAQGLEVLGQPRRQLVAQRVVGQRLLGNPFGHALLPGHGLVFRTPGAVVAVGSIAGTVAEVDDVEGAAVEQPPLSG